MRLTRRLLSVVLLLFVLLGVVAFVRAAGLVSRQPQVSRAPTIELDGEAVIAHLSEALRFPTVSHADRASVDATAFASFHAWLEETFPGMHSTLERERVGSFGLLYRWPGRRGDLAPSVLMAHQDVVPVLEESRADWSQPPFSGARAGGFVWGRGALDDKGPLVAICEAVEWLIVRGYRPERSLLLAFGHDEEVGGTDGAERIAALFARRGVEPYLVLDEGGALTQGLLPIERPIAVVGIAEKGYVTLRITARGVGGHSSTPPRDDAVTVLAEALVRLRERPFSAELSGPSAAMFETLAPELGLGARLVVANRWLLGPLVRRFLERDPTTAAMLRTTVAPTMLAASDKDNVLPVAATALVNFRIHPRDSIREVLEHVRRAVGPELEVEVSEGFASEPSPVSPTAEAPFELLARTIREVVPDAIVTPYLVMAGTDARHMSELTPFVYRFSPLRVDAGDMQRIHGTEERVAEDSLLEGVRFYVRLIENLDAGAVGAEGG